MFNQFFLTIIALIFISPPISAQEFSYQNKPASATNTSRSRIVIARNPPLSAQGFSNSVDSSYRKQQSQVSQIAAQKLKEQQIQQTATKQTPAKQPNNVPKPTTTTLPSPIETTTQQYRESAGSVPTSTTNEQPAATPAQTYQPYTGFQSTPPANTGGATPSNNQQKQNTGGWGSGIKY